MSPRGDCARECDTLHVVGVVAALRHYGALRHMPIFRATFHRTASEPP
jgi:hypothetical protein